MFVSISFLAGKSNGCSCQQWQKLRQWMRHGFVGYRF